MHRCPSDTIIHHHDVLLRYADEIGAGIGSGIQGSVGVVGVVLLIRNVAV